MNSEDISLTHQTSKKDSYWENLVSGSTAVYKEKAIEHLLKDVDPQSCEKILDIGCGTCELAFKYQNRFHSNSVTCMDYDPKVIEHLKKKYASVEANWVVADVFALQKWSERFNLVFLLDMIHEVYSFYGRPNRDLTAAIDRELGLKYVRDLLANVAFVTEMGGYVVITDNILCEEDIPLKVRMKNNEIKETIPYFLENYSTKNLSCHLINSDEFMINSRDFCILLSQYNKVKNKDWNRWKVERMEQHQYFTASEYEQEFNRLGFSLKTILATPSDALKEWSSDFEIVSGLENFPPKRVTLLAKKIRS